MTNFDYLKSEPKFEVFADRAIAAEMIFGIDALNCTSACRTALETAVKWMYSVEDVLIMPEEPKEQTLYNLVSTEEFKDIVGQDNLNRIHFVRLSGNKMHSALETKATSDQAELCLENLFYFLDFVAYCYSDIEMSNQREFDKELLKQHHEPVVISSEPDVDVEKLIKENESLKEELSARREARKGRYTPKPIDLSEFSTRKLYIDIMLRDAGWIEGRNWINEYELDGMPTQSGKGFADYVLFDDMGRPLAVIEAKSTCKDVAIGRQQAKLYADILESKFGRRPVIFLTNGFDTRIIDNIYPERKCAAIYSKRDLEKLFNLQSMRTSLKTITINPNIADRYYQKAAIKAVCDSFDEKNKRKALLVMATGSGKTRTIIGLVDVLLQHGWIKNVLFLADRNSLVTQAKRAFVNLLPDFNLTNLCEEKGNFAARGVFSTYQTMINCIDTAGDEEGRLFTCGHFDLIICDEAHRSIYNKYRDIFNYFDAPLVGLTATPKDEIEKNTYDIFDLGNGCPTYGYDLSQAVADGYLCDFTSIESTLKFIEEGIVYDELSDEDKEQYEKTFANEDGSIPESIDSSALNEWVFNESTIKEVLNILMTNGLKVDYGNKIGKTIIFAKNHRHAEKIYEVFNKEYPQYKGYAMVIDNYTNYAQSAIDDFSDPKKMPQIAISVDMLDTGIDVPEILNLVFFKKVMSKAKFWQMIGRGTRLCRGLIDGNDKEKFYIFDFCGNFEFFRFSKGEQASMQLSLSGALFKLKADIAYKLQDIDYQTDDLIKFRETLVDEMSKMVNELNRDNFAVKQHIKYVEKYSDKESYEALTYADTLKMADELAPLIIPDHDDARALRFDALLYGIELAYLIGNKNGKARKQLIKIVSSVSKIANISEIKDKSKLINSILHTDYLDTAGVNEFEIIRNELRDLIKYIPREVVVFNTNLEDEVLEINWKDSDLESTDLESYRVRAEYYIRQNQNNLVIAKLKQNKPLTHYDIEALEEVLWKEVGSKEEYEAEYGHKPLGELVREIVGLDMNAAKEAFSEYLNTVNLDSRQIYFVNQIIEYIVHNGMMKDLSVLQDTPFTDRGSVSDVFSDISVWLGIKKIIDTINENAIA